MATSTQLVVLLPVVVARAERQPLADLEFAFEAVQRLVPVRVRQLVVQLVEQLLALGLVLLV
jgi:hypothetical protein